MYQAPESEDKRHIISVSLQRAGRPQYWSFHCSYCQAKIVELDGDIVYMGDVFNDQKAPPVLVRCPGTNNKWCRYWYGFSVS